MADEAQNGMLRGHRAVREFLGVAIGVVAELIAYDATRPESSRVFVRHASDRRKVVRASKAGVLEIYREWCARP